MKEQIDKYEKIIHEIEKQVSTYSTFNKGLESTIKRLVAQNEVYRKCQDELKASETSETFLKSFCGTAKRRRLNHHQVPANDPMSLPASTLTAQGMPAKIMNRLKLKTPSRPDLSLRGSSMSTSPFLSH